MKAMTSRERFIATLNHRQPDRVCVDFGGTRVSGIYARIVHKLKQRLLGPNAPPTRVHEPYQMLAQVDEELRTALGADVIGVWTRKNIFGYEVGGWKPFTLFDGTPVQVPANFNVTPAPDGGWHTYPEGDMSVPPSGHMPKGGYFFDTIIRQEPLDEDNLNPEDNLEEFGLLNEADLAHYRQQVAWLDQNAKDTGVILLAPGMAFGDIALVPAPFLKRPKGIRDISQWYMVTAAEPDYVHAVFEKQCEFALKNLGNRRLDQLSTHRILISQTQRGIARCASGLKLSTKAAASSAMRSTTSRAIPPSKTSSRCSGLSRTVRNNFLTGNSNQ